jgi:tetratricopeptide (TPR) repeat protein
MPERIAKGGPMARKWSRGAVKALKLVERNMRGDLGKAMQEIDREIAGLKAGAKGGRDKAVKARVLIEHWRNGWADAKVLDHAGALAVLAVDEDDGDFYTHWKKAYTLKYRARSRGWGQMTEALSHYARALANLAEDDPSNTDALRSVLIDRGETFVYLSQADVGVAEMERALALKGTPQDWHVWAYAFALHQNGDYKKSADKLAPFLKGKPADDLYYNDMRLIIAASLARAGKKSEAQATIREFRKNRDAESEPVWTIALELERGCFLPGSSGETHWRESLEMLDAAALPR